MLLLALCKQRLYESMDLPTQVAGLVWYTLCYGLTLIGFLFLIGLGQAYGRTRDYRMLQEGAILAIIGSVTLISYSIFAFRPLIKFIQAFNSPYDPVDDPLQDSDIKSRSPSVQLRVEEKESYFVMLSSTYFRPLKSVFAVKNQEKAHKIKQMIEGFGYWGKEKSAEEKDAEPISIKAFKECKLVIDKKLSEIMMRPPRDAKGITIRSKKIRHPTVQLPGQKEPQEHDVEMGNGSKLCLSESDLDNVRKINDYSTKKNFFESESSCYICCEKTANAILMGCGHGGICYGCATFLIQKKNECMECRGPVESIVKLDMEANFTDIIKGVELTSVIVC